MLCIADLIVVNDVMVYNLLNLMMELVFAIPLFSSKNRNFAIASYKKKANSAHFLIANGIILNLKFLL